MHHEAEREAVRTSCGLFLLWIASLVTLTRKDDKKEVVIARQAAGLAWQSIFSLDSMESLESLLKIL